MKPLVLVGVILIALGVIGIVWGGITYTQHHDTADLGPYHINVSQKKTVPIPPVIGAVVLVAGVVVAVAGARRRAG